MTKSPSLLDLIGILLLLILAFSAWAMARALTWSNAVALIFIGYAAFRIVFELTWNRANVPTMATGFFGRRQMARILARDIAARGDDRPYNIVDLGSGRGELSRFLGRRLPQAQITGIELSRWPHKQAQFAQKLFGPTNVEFLCKNFDAYDCASADAVVMYLSGNLTNHVGEKLRRELRAGAIVIAHSFPLGGDWVPVEVVKFRTPFRERIFVYRVG